MSPCEDPSTHPQNQAKESRQPRRPRARRPRSRVCLLKGCTQTFRPDHPLERYCGDECRERARQWREWKARQRYRQSNEGKQKRRAQNRRYRLRIKSRKSEKPAAGSVARVIATKLFFRAPATAPVATRSFNEADVRRCNGSVPMRVAVLWSGFWSGKGAGESGSLPGDESNRISS